MRVLLRVLVPLLGLAVAVVGVLVVLEVVAAWVRPGATTGLVVPWPDWYTAAGRISWADFPVRVVAIAVAAVGLLLVLVGLLARRADVTLDGPAPEITVTAAPRWVARLVALRARSADDVSDARVTASRRAVSVTAEPWTDAVDDPADLHESVRERVEGLLDELPLARRPRVRVSVRPLRGPR